jgi:GWxTD domain-containing protein
MSSRFNISGGIMKHCTTVIASTLVLFGALTSAHGELSPEMAAWVEGPEQFLMTKDELKQWEKITTDAEAEGFIELFWARRNPNPDEAFNPFKADFEGRVRYADEHFSCDDERGALSDRARVIYLLGVPHAAEHRAASETVQVIGTETNSSGMGTDEVRSNAIMWMYDPARLPKNLKVRGTRVYFVFYEEKTASNNFILDRSHQEAPLAFRALSRAPEAYVLHPYLDEVPKPVSVHGGSPAAGAQLAALDAAAAPFDDRALLFADPGVADPAHIPLWFHLELPSEAPELETIAGRVRSFDGKVISTFQTAARALKIADSRAYHLTFPIAPGSYRIELAGFAGGQAQVRAAIDREVPPAPLDKEWLTPVWAGVSVLRDEQAPLGAAFTLGGWHLVPIAGAPVAKDSELSIFGFVVRPGMTEDGTTPGVTTRIALKRGGQRLGSPLRLDLDAAKVIDGLHFYATTLDLAAFPEAGEYRLEIKVESRSSEAEVRREVVLELVE